MRRVLVLGGTAWLGNWTARLWAAEGAEVTCLARGASGSAPEAVRLLAADRTKPGAYDALDGEWDEVVELAWEPELVRSALDALADRAKHWTLVSTMSVYRDNDTTDADESAPLVEPVDLSDYGQAKVAAEQATANRLGDRLLIARPGLIVGPGDPTDRFGYWPARLRLSGRVLAPTLADRFVQVIDVADLADWLVHAGKERLTGTFNTIGEPHTFDDFLTHVRISLGFDGTISQTDDDWLLAHDVRYWAGPRSLPLWLPADMPGFARRSNARYLAAGGKVRPLRTTIDLVRDDELARGVKRARRSGLTLQEEAELLLDLN